MALVTLASIAQMRLSLGCDWGPRQPDHPLQPRREAPNQQVGGGQESRLHTHSSAWIESEGAT